MKGDYPRFKAMYTHEELVEHFLLSSTDREMIDTCYTYCMSRRNFLGGKHLRVR